MVNFRFFGGISVLALVLLAPFRAVSAQGGGTLVRPDPIVLEVGEGQIETLQILLVNAINIYGIDLQASFDPSVVEVVDADSKQSGVQMTPGGFLKPDFVVRNVADNRAGTLQYVATQLNPTPPANGGGVVLLIKFRGKAIEARSKFTIISVQIADRRGVKQPVTVQDADLIIVPQKPPTLTPVLIPTHISAMPIPFASTITRAKSQSTPLPTKTAQQDFPTATIERNSISPDQILTRATIGGFSGSILLFGLSFWMLMAKHHRKSRKRAK